MSVFEITELAEHVGTYLSAHDATICVRVNKTWHTFFAPFIWRTLATPFIKHTISSPPSPPPSPLSAPANQSARNTKPTSKQHNTPRQPVLEGYLFSQQQQLPDPVLSRTAHWIRDMTNQQSLCSLPLPSRPITVATTDPKELDLISHLLKRCPNLGCLHLYGQMTTFLELKFWRGVASSNGLPETVKELGITLQTHVSLASSSIPSIIFSQCSAELQVLRLRILEVKSASSTQWPYLSLVKEKETEREPLTRLREVSVTCGDKDSYPRSWSQFLKRCINLESLHVTTIDQSWTQALGACTSLKRLEIEQVNTRSLHLLTETLKTGLPTLDAIQINRRDYEIPDQDLADMLSACRSGGWRSISLPMLGLIAAEALVKHCPTFETMELKLVDGLSSISMRKIPRSSPRLESFITLVKDDCCAFSVPGTTHISARDFINVDTSSGCLRPWKCESMLKVFRAMISGIPRPDVTRTFNGQPLEKGMVPQETHPGESQEIQRQVYERLARFTRLERLELRYEDRNLDANVRQYVHKRTEESWDDEYHQYECVAMNLQSGLGILAGLKELRVVSVMRMSTLIGVEEMRWMAESWPRLKEIVGLNTEGNELETEKWLKENCPSIKSEPCTFYP